jgi:hypothetical protein
MAMRPTPQQVCAKAIVYGCLGFRASLEVTEHPRAKSLCSQLLPWLKQLGLGDQIEELYQEILAVPHGNLSAKDRSEAFWRGDSAWLLGWAIELFDKPEANASIDPALLLSNLRILQPTAADLLSNAKLRSQVEIDDYCVLCIAVWHQRQLASVSEEGRSTLHGIHQKYLRELDLTEAYGRIENFEQETAKVAAAPAGMEFQYVARAFKAAWLCGKEW